MRRHDAEKVIQRNRLIALAELQAELVRERTGKRRRETLMRLFETVCKLQRHQGTKDSFVDKLEAAGTSMIESNVTVEGGTVIITGPFDYKKIKDSFVW